MRTLTLVNPVGWQ